MVIRLIPHKIISLSLAFLLLFLSGCGNAKNSDSETITVYAASSLIDVFNELAHGFESEHKDAHIQMQYAGSAQLAIQITQGAPAQIFASANAQQINVVAEEGLVKGEPTIFARNELVLIVPEDNPANIQDLADIAQPDVKIVTATIGVPIRDYTDILLDNLMEDAAYDAEFHVSFYANLRSEETNVRQVVLKTALGEADAAIVYRTDITTEVAEQLQIIEIPQKFAPQPVYFIAVIKTGNSTKVAEDFIAYIMSDAGQAILRDYGFVEATASGASNE